mgnify:CR=1 FL=1
MEGIREVERSERYSPSIIIDELISSITKLLERIHSKDKNAGRAFFYAIINNVAQKIDVDLPYEKFEELSIDEYSLKQLKQYEKIIDKLATKVLEKPDLIDEIYQRVTPLEYRKGLGQIFTPAPIAEFMASWGLLDNDVKEILDPGVGTGIFISRIAKFLKNKDENIRIIGIDMDPLLLNAAYIRIAIENKSILNKLTLIKGDYLLWEPITKFDLVISNPPYIKFHGYDRKVIDYLSTKFNLRLTKLANIYALFMIKSLSELRDGKKAVFITPSEYLYTGYGEIVKEFILKDFTIIGLILVGLENSVFKEVMTTGLITLIRRGRAAANHEVLFINAEGITNLDLTILSKPLRKVPQLRLNPHDKWLKYFFNESLNQYLSKLKPLSSIAIVKRGIATGYNEFFTLDEKTIQKYKIPLKCLKPVISKAKHSPYYDFTINDWERLKQIGEPVYLLYCFTLNPPEELKEYLNYGVRLGVPNRYLTSHRKRWWWVEKRDPAPILALVFSRERMRFVYNKAQVLSLTPFHLIYPKFKDEVMLKALLAYLNSNIGKEIATIYGRIYGTGLRKVEPRDLEKLPVLDVTAISRNDLELLSDLFDELCKASRQGESLEEEVKSKIDEVILNILARIGQSSEKVL